MFDEAPVQIAAWFGCLAFGLMICNEGGKFLDRMRGKSPHPANEVLGAHSAEVTRRVEDLERDNKAVWEKMEADRIESKDAFIRLSETIGGLKSSVENISSQTSLLNLKLDNLTRRP
jgi:hypothetical protein